MGLESASYSAPWKNAGHMIFMHQLCTRLQLYGHVKDLEDLHGDYGTLLLFLWLFTFLFNVNHASSKNNKCHAKNNWLLILETTCCTDFFLVPHSRRGLYGF